MLSWSSENTRTRQGENTKFERCLQEMCKGECKQSENKRLSCAFYEEFDGVLRVINIVKLPHVCEVGVAEELAQSPP